MARFCKNCGKELGEGVLFCKYCGAQAPEEAQAEEQEKRFCIACGQEMAVNALFCPRCGAQAPAEPQAALQGAYTQPPQGAYAPQQPVYAPVYAAPQPPPKKKGKGIVVLLILVVILGGVGWFGFREGGFLRGILGDKPEPAEKTPKPTASATEKPSAAKPSAAPATVKPTEVPPEPTQAPPPAAPGEVTGWQGTFNGTALPGPETGGEITEWQVKDDSVTIRIDGMSYEEYIAYCKKLEALSGWEVVNDEDTAHFPDDYNQRSKVYFTGAYGDLPHIAVQYYSDQQCQNSGYPHFCMFVFTEW